MKKILLENTGHYALVDNEDYEMVMAFGKWYENDKGYAIKRHMIDGKNKTIRMHALINDTPPGLVTDHINRNKLDNRRKNLRSVGVALNNWNSRPRSHQKYDLPSGISYDKNRNKYYAQQTIRKRFDRLEDAVKFANKSKKEVL